jgi:uncharacterized membrane protein (UPF0127 family)
MSAESFLTGTRAGDDLQALVNERTGRVLASAVELAETSDARRKGLLGRDALDPSAALIIAPCWSIHTFFMRFVIDAVFVDRAGVVLKIVPNLKPWRIAFGPRAFAVVEVNGGAVRRSGVEVGDRLLLRPSTLRA